MDLASFDTVSYSLLEVSDRTRLGNPLGSFKSQTLSFYNKAKPKNKDRISLYTFPLPTVLNLLLSHSVCYAGCNKPCAHGIQSLNLSSER